MSQSLWIYGLHQLGGLTLGALSILSMLAADRALLSREPKPVLLFLLGLSVSAGIWGAIKARRHCQKHAGS